MPDHPSPGYRLAAFVLFLWRTPEWWGKPILIAAALVLVAIAAIWLHALDNIDKERLTPKAPTKSHTVVEPSRRAYRPRGTVYIPLVLDNVTVDLQPKLGGSLHVGIVGPTGLGKSSAVLPLFDLDIAVVTVALDNTRPIRNKVRVVGGWDWTNDPRECGFGLDLLNVSVPAATAELVVSGLPRATGDSGQWRRAAIARLTRTLIACDQAGIERNWPDLIRALRLKTEDHPADMACGEWASKLEQVYMLCGQNFGSDLNIVDAIRGREKVLLRTNHFLSTEVGPMVGGWLMILARLAAHEANMPFVLIVEEANQAELFARYISPVAQAARDRDVALAWIGQNGSKMPDEVIQNTKVWVCSPQVMDKERRFCGNVLDIDPERLRISTFPKTNPPSDQGLGWFFVNAPGLTTTLVHLPKPEVTRRARVETARESVGVDVGTPVSEWVTAESPFQPSPRPINHWDPYPPALPEPYVEPVEREPYPEWLGQDPKYEAWWDQCQRVGPAILWCPCHGLRYDVRGCREWTGTTSNPNNGAPARPRANYRRKDVSVYREFFNLAYGQYPQPTCDHLCDNPLCCEPSHLEACGIDENNRRQGQREKVFKIADWRRVDRMHQSGGMKKPVRVARWTGQVPLAA